MIDKIYIDNYKSLFDFRVKLTKFNCIIGLNGSGKTAILESVEAILGKRHVTECLRHRINVKRDMKMKGILNNGRIVSATSDSKPDLIKSVTISDDFGAFIDQESIENLVDRLVKSKKQTLITTHNPLVLNFIDDDIARESIIYLYKDSKGTTKSTRLFDIPSMSKKLEFMGAGEALIDTDLRLLNKYLTGG